MGNFIRGLKHDIYHLDSNLSDDEVIVMDSLPYKEGLTSLRKLTDKGIKCSYCMLPSLKIMLKKVINKCLTIGK